MRRRIGMFIYSLSWNRWVRFNIVGEFLASVSLLLYPSEKEYEDQLAEWHDDA